MMLLQFRHTNIDRHSIAYFQFIFFFLFIAYISSALQILIETLGYILRTSLYFYFYFRTCTYLQLMGYLDMMQLILSCFFFLFSSFMHENLNLNLPWVIIWAVGVMKEALVSKSHSKQEREFETLMNLSTHELTACVHACTCHQTENPRRLLSL